MRRKSKTDPNQLGLLEARVATAPCVPAIRKRVNEWRTFELKSGMRPQWPKTGYKGVSETTRILLAHWFYTDHRLPDGGKFAYHYFQQEAIVDFRRKRGHGSAAMRPSQARR